MLDLGRSILLKPILAVLVGTLLAFPLHAAENIDPAKIAAIKELMEMTGAQANRVELTRNFSQQLISVLEANHLSMTPELREMIRIEVDEFIQAQLDDEILQAKMYRVYARYFTLEELQGLIAFNRTPIGQKANRVMPVLMRETMSAAQEWSVEIGPELSARVKQRLEREGIRLESLR